MGLDVYEYRVYAYLKRRHDNGNGDEVVSYREVAEHCEMSAATAHRAVHSLAQRKLIVPHKGWTPGGAKAILEHKVGQTFNPETTGTKVCRWCSGQAIVLHDHHYPVAKADGGTETVAICPNCHAEYHELVKAGYRIKVQE